jgi:hypothetical protein
VTPPHAPPSKTRSPALQPTAVAAYQLTLQQLASPISCRGSANGASSTKSIALFDNASNFICYLIANFRLLRLPNKSSKIGAGGIVPPKYSCPSNAGLMLGNLLPGRPQSRLQAVTTACWDGKQIIVCRAFRCRACSCVLVLFGYLFHRPLGLRIRKRHRCPQWTEQCPSDLL